MPTSDMEGCTGVVGVILASAKRQEKKLAESQLYNVPDTRNIRSVNYVALKHKTDLRWMFYLLMAILGILIILI